jgi:hypothetical protein
MNTYSLKLFSGHMIVSTGLSEQSKLQLLNYIQEASEYQVKVFLLDAEIMNVVNDEVCREIVDQRFYSSDLPAKIRSFIDEWDGMLVEEK